MSGLMCSLCACLAALVILAGPALSKDLKASLAQVPVYAESAKQGVLVDLVKAIAKESGVSIDYQVVPFKRSINDLINKKVDFHMPLIKNPIGDEASLPYDHSTVTLFRVNFVLYSNKNKRLDINKLGQYKIETDSAHVQYFPFEINQSSSLVSSLRKVDAGRIDGFIFADNASDFIIRQNHFKSIHRQLYKEFEVKIILPKGGRGGEVDKLLSDSIAKLQATGEYAKIVDKVDREFQDWQP